MLLVKANFSLFQLLCFPCLGNKSLKLKLKLVRLLIIWSGYWSFGQVIDHLVRLLITWSGYWSLGQVIDHLVRLSITSSGYWPLGRVIDHLVRLLTTWSVYWSLGQVTDYLVKLLTTWSDHWSPGEDGVLDSHSRRQEVSSRSIQRQKCFAHRRTKKVQKEGNMTKVLHASLLSLRPTGDFFPVFVLSINLLLSSASISQSATFFKSFFYFPPHRFY